ncbi:MAG: AAA family ATPase [Cyanothece sp. SIO1E1]|nr:AAA family ATPase [Cyanothece sp. SIO1E1]
MINQTSLLGVKPIITYPRKAQVGKTYLMTIDLQIEDGEWQYDEEEYPIYCSVNSTLFSSKPVGEPVVILHRFGGNYGAANFLIKTMVQEVESNIRITLSNRWGFYLQTLIITPTILNDNSTYPEISSLNTHLYQADFQTSAVEANKLDDSTHFRNRSVELRKLSASRGEIVVVDALSGYGKTAFLKEVARQYDEQQWLVCYISLNSRMQPRDIWTETLRELDRDIAIEPSSFNHFLAAIASSSRLQNIDVAVLFDDIHTLSNDTLEWLTQVFAYQVLEALRKIRRSDDGFLLVFSGNNIAHSILTTWPLDRRSIYLHPFDRSTIQEFIDAVPNEKFQYSLSRVARYRKWLTEKLTRLCGGHPRALLNLLGEIESGDWLPNPALDEHREFYQSLFERHVLVELDNLTRELSESYRQLLENLCIYRTVNSETVKVVLQDSTVDNNENSLKVVQTLRHHKLYLAKEKVLDPVIRNGLTTRLMIEDPQRYVALNRTALEFYKEQLARFDGAKQPFESAQNLAAEAIYHCLCYSREVPDLKNCLSFTTRHLDELLTTQADEEEFTGKEIIIELVDGDEDIRTLLYDYDISLKEVFREIENEKASIFRNETDVTGIELTTRYTSGIVGLLGEDQASLRVVGTGYLVWHIDQWLVITCAHILNSLRLQEGDTVSLKHLMPTINRFEAQVLKFNPPNDSPLSWNAYDDVAILRPLDLLPTNNLTPFPLYQGEHYSSIYPTGEQSICFGYPHDRHTRGSFIKDLDYANTVANGFIELSNGEDQKIKPGFSGAPWGHKGAQAVVGMVQTVLKNGGRTYLIPSSIILKVISDYFSSIEVS